MKKNGFTLIELLAVILIVAIIALIVTPTVLNLVEEAKVNSVKTSTYGYLEAFNNYIVKSELDDTLRQIEPENSYNINKQTNINETIYQGINNYVNIKGYIPTGGDDYVTLDSQYQVIEGELTINGYIVVISNGKIATVTKGNKIKVISFSVENTDVTIEKNSEYTIVPIFDPVIASDQRVKYESSNSDIVTVSDVGIVKGINTGSSVITVTSLDDTSKKVEINVTVISTATGITVSINNSNIYVGDEAQLTATLEPSDATTGAGITWTSSPTGVVEISDTGLVTGIHSGATTITGTTANNLTSTVDVVVSPVLATSISLSPASATIYLGSMQQLTTEILPSNTTNQDITYTSSNTNVATVTSTGLVVSVALGTTTITATTSNGVTTSSSITVAPILATSISVSPASATIYSGATQQLTAAILPNNTTNKSITWSSSNTGVATVSGTGLVTGLSYGTATITGTTSNGLTSTSVITVINKTYTGGTIIYFDPKTSNTCDSTTFNLTNVNAGTSSCFKWRTLSTGDAQTINTVKIMLDHNIVNLSAWDTGGTNLYGPRTAMANLATATSTWAKVSLLNYTFTDVSSTGGYGTLTCTNGTCVASRNSSTVSTNSRARMITAEEIVAITGVGWTTASNVAYFSNSTSGTATQFKDLRYSWLVENLTSSAVSGSTSDIYGTAHLGYWTLNSRASSNSQSWDVANSGQLYAGDAVTGSTFCGIRPVIEISKALIK